MTRPPGCGVDFWPAFTTADGTPVAAGSTSVTLGNAGALQVALVSNVGASPSGTYYRGAFQLDDVVRTEYWLVGTTSPTQVTYHVTTADGSTNTYDISIYDNSGNLKVHTGPMAGSTAMSPTGAHTAQWVGGAALQPGRYYLAITSSCTASCALMVAMDGNGITFLSNYQINVSAGGTLNGNMTPPADSFAFGSYLPRSDGSSPRTWMVERFYPALKH
jgi:hypothetical protein